MTKLDFLLLLLCREILWPLVLAVLSSTVIFIIIIFILLLNFIGTLGYVEQLLTKWSGNCEGKWSVRQTSFFSSISECLKHMTHQLHLCAEWWPLRGSLWTRVERPSPWQPVDSRGASLSVAACGLAWSVPLRGSLCHFTQGEALDDGRGTPSLGRSRPVVYVCHSNQKQLRLHDTNHSHIHSQRLRQDKRGTVPFQMMWRLICVGSADRCHANAEHWAASGLPVVSHCDTHTLQIAREAVLSAAEWERCRHQFDVIRHSV